MILILNHKGGGQNCVFVLQDADKLSANLLLFFNTVASKSRVSLVMKLASLISLHKHLMSWAVVQHNQKKKQANHTFVSKTVAFLTHWQIP